jgi:hypothetical protein
MCVGPEKWQPVPLMRESIHFSLAFLFLFLPGKKEKNKIKKMGEFTMSRSFKTALNKY